MDIIKNPKYENLQAIYNKYFTFGYLNTDFTTKMALISLTCYIVNKLKQKKPDITHYQILKKYGDGIPEDIIKGMAVVCCDMAYGCKDFQTFGLNDKQILAKIKEILDSYVPF